MTICAALKTVDNKLFLGCDTLLVSEIGTKSQISSKIIDFAPGIWIAWAGASTISHILSKKRRRKFKPPENATECFELLSPVFQEYKDKIESTTAFNKNDDYWIDLLVVTKSKIFTVNEFGAEEHKEFAAIGAGSDFALGVLFSLQFTIDCLKLALKAACRFSTSCGEPIVIKEIK